MPEGYGGDLLDVFRTCFGPSVTAFEAVGPSRAPELEAAIREVLTRYDDGVGGRTALRCEYLQTVASRA
jgi:hypothetical protein